MSESQDTDLGSRENCGLDQQMEVKLYEWMKSQDSTCNQKRRPKADLVYLNTWVDREKETNFNLRDS